MSQAFVRERDDMWLHDVGPSLNALTNFLTLENNGIRVYLEKSEIGDQGRELYFMSNGLAYMKNDKGQWEVA
jgi:hypothetical protein